MSPGSRKYSKNAQWNSKIAMVASDLTQKDSKRRTLAQSTRTGTRIQKQAQKYDELALVDSLHFNNRVAQCVKVQIPLSSPDGKGGWVPSR